MPQNILYERDGLPKPAWSLYQTTQYARERWVARWQQTPRGQRWMRKVAEWNRRDRERRKHHVVSGIIDAMPCGGYDFDTEGVVCWLYDHGYLKDSK